MTDESTPPEVPETIAEAPTPVVEEVAPVVEAAPETIDSAYVASQEGEVTPPEIEVKPQSEEPEVDSSEPETPSTPLPEPPNVVDAPAPAPQPTSSPAPANSPTYRSPREFLALALASIQSRKAKKLTKIVEYVKAKSSVTNDEIQKLLRVSDATATRYLAQLVREGKLRRVGDSRTETRYEPV